MSIRLRCTRAWLPAVPAVCLLTACSVIVDNKLDDKAGPRDAAVEGPVRIDATTKDPRIDASMEPRRVYPDDTITLKVTVFNFKLAKNVNERAPDEGFYAVSFSGKGVNVPLFKSTARERSFRLDEFPQLIDAAPEPGSASLVITLHDGNAERVFGDGATVELPFDLCIPGVPHPGCDGVIEPPVLECRPQDGCDPCTDQLFPPEVGCPACIHPACAANDDLSPCVQFGGVSPVLLSRPDEPIQIDLVVDHFDLKGTSGGPGGAIRLAVTHGLAPKTEQIGELFHEPSMKVTLPDKVLGEPLVLLTAQLVDQQNTPVDGARACWPILLLFEEVTPGVP